MTEPSRGGIDWEIAKPATATAREETEFLLTRGGSIRDFFIALIGVTIPLFVLFRAYFGPTDFRLERTVVIVLVLCHLFLFLPMGGKERQRQMRWLACLDWFLF